MNGNGHQALALTLSGMSPGLRAPFIREVAALKLEASGILRNSPRWNQMMLDEVRRLTESTRGRITL